jgi:hypothetical protein
MVHNKTAASGQKARSTATTVLQFLAENLRPVQHQQSLAENPGPQQKLSLLA